MYNVVLVGSQGYWGKILKRNLLSRSDVKLDCVDLAGEDHTSLEEVLSQAVAGTKVFIATPPATHYPLAKICLDHGCSFIVEKPAFDSYAKCVEILKEAEDKQIPVGVDHTFLFHPTVRKIAKLLNSGVIGDVNYIQSDRLGFGKFQPCGVFWDLLPHDLSIISLLTGSSNCRLVNSYNIDGVPFVGQVAGSNFSVNVSWISTEKVRRLTVYGDQGAIKWDLGSPFIEIYDFNISRPSTSLVLLSKAECKDTREPLAIMIDEFLKWDNPDSYFISRLSDAVSIVKNIEGLI